MQLSNLKKVSRLLKASALLMLAFLVVTTLTPIGHAQEQINRNNQFLNFPGGIGNSLPVNFPAASTTAKNVASDVITADLNGDGNEDVLVGSLNSTEVNLFLGRGNGSFVAVTGAVPFGISAFFRQNPADSTFDSNGTVTSMTLVKKFGPSSTVSDDTSIVAVAVDYSDDLSTTATPVEISDAVVYLSIRSDGEITVENDGDVATLPLYKDGVNTITLHKAVRFQSNPVSVAVGNLGNASANADLVVLCSGLFEDADQNGETTTTDIGNAGFLYVDRLANGVSGGPGDNDQVLGCGVAAPVVNEFVDDTFESGSLYDVRSDGNVNGAFNGHPANTYQNVVNIAENRRKIRVIPRGEYSRAKIAPRAVIIANFSHGQDSGNDIGFVGIDNGSVGGPNRNNESVDLTAAPSKSPEGAFFILSNDLNDGDILRSVRDLQREPYNTTTSFVNGAPFVDGFIGPTGNLPSGIAVADFQGAGSSLSIGVSNFASNNISNVPPTLIATFDNKAGSVGNDKIPSYIQTQRIFTTLGRANPNTIYSKDLDIDGAADFFGSDLLDDGGYVGFNNTKNNGRFNLGKLIFQTPAGISRALAGAEPTFNGISPTELMDFNPNDPNAGSGQLFGDMVSVGVDGGVQVRYGLSIQPGVSVTYGRIQLSSFVGVSEGLIDADKSPDLAIYDRGADRVLIALNTATGDGFSGVKNVGRLNAISVGDFFPRIKESATGGISSGDLGDIEGDGDLDLAISVDGDGNDEVIFLFNDNTGFKDFRGQSRQSVQVDDPTCIKFADVTSLRNDGTFGLPDGAPELIALSRASENVVTLVNSGPGFGQFKSSRVSGVGGSDLVSQALGDFNNDGKIDTAVVCSGRRAGGGGQQDESAVDVLLGRGDGSFDRQQELILVPPIARSITAAGYGVVQNGVQRDIQDTNNDGLTDLIVACSLGGRFSDPNLHNPFHLLQKKDGNSGVSEAASLTLLNGSETRPGAFESAPTTIALTNILRDGSRVAIYPGAYDVRDGRLIGYQSVIMKSDFNANGRPDIQTAGVEDNTGSTVDYLAASITSADNGKNGAGFINRTVNIFPSSANDIGTVTGQNPTDLDNVTGIETAGAFVDSLTGNIVTQRDHDFFFGLGQFLPDNVYVTSIGRAYESINISSVANHAPIASTSKGLADFNGPDGKPAGGRRLVMKEGTETTLTLKAADVDQLVRGFFSWRLVSGPGFVTLTNNSDGTASVKINPGLNDGSSVANNGLGQMYHITAAASDNAFVDPLEGFVHFWLYVQDAPTGPSIAAIPDVTMFVTDSRTVVINATSPTGKSVTILQPDLKGAEKFSTFTAEPGKGTATLKINPVTDDQAGVYIITVVAKEGPPEGNGLTSSTTFTLTVVKNNAPVVGLASSTVNMFAGTVQKVTFTASDPDKGQVLTPSLLGDASFAKLSFDGSTGSIELTPSINDAGKTFNITLKVTDNGQPTPRFATANLTVTVNAQVLIESVSYSTSQNVLTITGKGFGTTPALTINGKSVTPKSVTDTSITVKGKSKAISLAVGNNTIEVTGLGGQKATKVFDFQKKKFSDDSLVSLTTKTSNRFNFSSVIAPVVGAVTDVLLQEGDVKDIRVTATDPDTTQRLTLYIASKPSFITVTEVANGTWDLRIAPGILQGDVGVNTVTLTVADNGTPQKVSAPVTFKVTVIPRLEIRSASFGDGRLIIDGYGFGPEKIGVIINGNDTPEKFIIQKPDQNFRSISVAGKPLAKRTKKTLKLKSGDNQIQVVVGSRKSNVFTIHI